jgi:hypothetical protein
MSEVVETATPAEPAAPQSLTVEQAAERYTARMAAESTTEEEAPDSATVAEPEAEAAEAAKEEVKLPETLDQLAEALGIDSDTLLRTVKHKVKAAGSEHEVTLADLQKDFQLESHRRQQIQKAAETRKAVEARQREIAEQAEMSELAYQRMIAGVAQAAQADLQNPQFEALRTTDPNRYWQRREEILARVRSLQDINNQARDFYTQQKQASVQRNVQAAYEKFVDLRPDLVNAPFTKAKEVMTELQYSDNELQQPQDHRPVIMAYEIAELRAKLAALEGAKAKTKEDLKRKLEVKVPKFEKPSAPRSTAQQAQTRVLNAQNKAKTSGRVDDVAALYLAKKAARGK